MLIFTIGVIVIDEGGGCGWQCLKYF